MPIMENGFDIDLPRMVRVRQVFPRPKEVSFEGAVRREISRPEIVSLIKPGSRIAIGAGSRGVAGIFPIIRETVRALKELGARPFVVPAMGSHGGATADGQREVLESYGITEESIGAPVVSSMEVVRLGETPSGIPVHFDRNAYEADAVIPINRVKLHTDFRGPVESGLCKMLTIGFGKHKGATALHTQGFDRFDKLIPQAAEVVLARAPVAFGLAVIENAYEEVARIQAVPANDILRVEPLLLREATSLMAKILFDPIDVLVVDEMGKDISGSGMDPNINGRFSIQGKGSLSPRVGPRVTRIAVLDLTEKTHGNATGIGDADVVTRRLVDKINYDFTYVNCITSTVLERGRIPITLENDHQAIVVAVRSCSRTEPSHARIVRIKNTLETSEIMISEPMLEEARRMGNIEALGDPEPMTFDSAGNLTKM
ncbi:MAG: nickel-dependent lactate racemase [Actinobacteria bacterium]|nr:nickel-dependent lactate racemase [Actinomycetota bacterium]